MENILEYAATGAMTSSQAGGVKPYGSIERKKKVAERRMAPVVDTEVTNYSWAIQKKKSKKEKEKMAQHAADSFNVARSQAEMKARRAAKEAAKETDERIGSSSWNSAISDMLDALPPPPPSALDQKAMQEAEVARQRRLTFLANMAKAAAKAAEARGDASGYKRKTSKKSRKRRSLRKKYRKQRTRRTRGY
jgi:hypothetical protein